MYISHKESVAPASAEQIDRGVEGESTFATLETDAGVMVRVFSTPFTPENPRVRPGGSFRPVEGAGGLEIQRAVLVVARPIRDTEEALRRLSRILIIAFPLILILAGGGGVFLARRAFKPVERITNTAREIEETDLSRRIDVKSKDELGSLAGALNQMIGRLEGAFERQKQFTGDASHELRAPLAVIQAEATLALQKERDANAYRTSIEMISQETDHMSAVLNQLLTLARADAGKEQLKFERIDLAQFI
ncbi:MAG: HAMP domain-containing protein, partial [Desulfobacterales bacterium]|nr:HAMP domain-containing protein [Desulfobacterales bacterium]